MKRLIGKILHLIYYSTIVALATIVLFCVALSLFSINLGRYHTGIENRITQLLDKKISFSKVGIGYQNFAPVLKLSNIVIFDQNETHKLFVARELRVGIDLLSSLVLRKAKVNFFALKGSKVSIHLDAASPAPRVNEVSLASLGQNPQNFLTAIENLFGQEQVEIRDFDVTLYLANGQTVNLQAINLLMAGGVFKQRLVIQGKIVGPVGTGFGTVIGNLVLADGWLSDSSTKIRVSGDLAIMDGNFDLDQVLAYFETREDSQPTLFTKLDLANLRVRLKDCQVKYQLFRTPRHISQLQFLVDCHDQPEVLNLNLSDLRFLDSNLEFTGYAHLRYLKLTHTPWVKIRGKYNLTNLNKASLYYPASVMPPNALLWLDQAFPNSKPISGELLLEGDLSKFPFDQQEGRFIVASRLRNVDLNYDSAWPQVNELSGKMIFSNRSMHIYTKQAKILGSPVKYIQADIPNLAAPILKIAGEIESDSKVGLAFVHQSALHETIGRNLQAISLGGKMLLKLKFAMPLADDLPMKETIVAGNIELTDNRLVPKHWELFSIQGLHGTIDFTSNSMVSRNLTGRLFEQPVKIAIGRADNVDHPFDPPVTKVQIEGSAKISDLNPLLSKTLQESLAGAFNYRVELGLSADNRQTLFQLESDLLGVSSQLPAPFHKVSQQSLGLFLKVYVYADDNLKLLANYGNRVTAAVAARISSGTRQLKFMAGELQFGSGRVAAFSQEEGLSILGKLNLVDWNQWKKIFGSHEQHWNLSLKRVSLKIAKFYLWGRLFEQVELLASFKKNLFEVTVKNSKLDGTLLFPRSAKKAIKGLFRKLNLDKEANASLEQIKCAEIPPLDLEIYDLSYGEKQFKHLRLSSEPMAQGMKFKQLRLDQELFTLNASGEWACRLGKSLSKFTGQFSSPNLGNLLSSSKITDSLSKGTLESSFQLSWKAAPYHFSFKQAEGTFSVTAKEGSIINLRKSMENQLSISRLLNILSLNSLPKRLTLDFSDVTKHGFVFNTIHGHLALKEGGDILIKQLGLEGPSASIKVGGRVGLSAEDYDLMLYVAPKLTSSVPIAATIAGGPVIGAVSFVADKLISKALKHVNIYKYHVTGSWSPKEPVPNHN